MESPAAQLQAFHLGNKLSLSHSFRSAGITRMNTLDAPIQALVPMPDPNSNHFSLGSVRLFVQRCTHVEVDNTAGHAFHKITPKCAIGLKQTYSEFRQYRGYPDFFFRNRNAEQGSKSSHALPNSFLHPRFLACCFFPRAFLESSAHKWVSGTINPHEPVAKRSSSSSPLPGLMAIPASLNLESRLPFLLSAKLPSSSIFSYSAAFAGGSFVTVFFR